MSIKVGTDLLEVERFRTVMERRPGLRRKLFTELELAYCDTRPDPIPHLAARFCAKEAFSKALGTGIREFSMSEVEVVRNELGKPSLRLFGGAADVAKRIGVGDLDISISHSAHFAVAVVVIQCSENG